MQKDYKYYAFISYSHKDEEWARWLQHEFEHYHLPISLNGRSGLPSQFRPIFRDIDELSGGELQPQITEALANSAYLIIVCSPNSAQSKYVNDEIHQFVKQRIDCGKNRISRIFPFIIDGVPHSSDQLTECFPEVLRQLPTELIAGDAVKHGRDQAFVKILAGTLRESGIDFNMLWNQYERDKIEAERRKRKEREHLQRVESRYLSEKANALTNKGDSYLASILSLKALPSNLSNPERPYCIEAEYALRTAQAKDNDGAFSTNHRSWGVSNYGVTRDGRYLYADNGLMTKKFELISGALIFEQQHPMIASYGSIFSPDFAYMLSNDADEQLYLIKIDTGTCKIVQHEGFVDFDFSPDGKKFVTITRNGDFYLWRTNDLAIILSSNAKGAQDCRCVFFGSDDSTIVVGTENGKLIKIDIATGAHTHSYTDIDASSIWRISYSADHSIIAYATCGKVALLYAADLQPTSVQFQFEDDLNDFCLSPDGRLIAINVENDFSIYDTCNSSLIAGPFHDGNIARLFFSADGKKVISAGFTSRIWDIERYLGHPMRLVRSAVNSVEFSYDSDKIAVSSKNCNIWIYDTYSGNILAKLPSIEDGEEICYASFGPNDTIASLQGYSKTFVIHPDFHSKEHKRCDLTDYLFYPTVKFNLKGDNVVVISENGETIWFGADTAIQKKHFEISDFMVSPFLTHFPIQFTHCADRITAFNDRNLAILDTNTGNIISKSLLADEYVKLTTINGDGTYMAALVYKLECSVKHPYAEIHRIVLADANCNIKKGFYIPIDIPPCGLAFSPDSSMLIGAYASGDINIWNTNTGDLIQHLPGAHTAPVSCLSFSPDGRFMASGSEDGTLKIWSLSYGKFEYIRRAEFAGTVFRPIVSHDKRILAVPCSYDYDADNYMPHLIDEIKIIDNDNGRIIAGLSHRDEDNYVEFMDIESICICHDHSMIAAFLGYEIVIWNTHDGKIVRRIKIEPATRGILFFTNDDRAIAIACNGEIKAWSVATGQPWKRRVHMEEKTSVDVAETTEKEEIQITLPNGENRTLIIDKEEEISEFYTDAGVLSPDGCYKIIAEDKSLSIWHVETRRLACKPYVFDEEIVHAGFSPDGRRIIVITLHGLIETIDWPALQELIDTTRLRFANTSITSEDTL